MPCRSGQGSNSTMGVQRNALHSAGHGSPEPVATGQALRTNRTRCLRPSFDLRTEHRVLRTVAHWRIESTAEAQEGALTDIAGKQLERTFALCSDAMLREHRTPG